MSQQAISGLALSQPQYQALQAPVLQIPSPIELFDFQVGVFKRMEIRITTEDVLYFRPQVPTSPSLFLLIPPSPRLADYSVLLKRMAKLNPEIQGCLEPSMVILESLKSEDDIPSDSHLIFGCSDGSGGIQKSAQARAAHFKSNMKMPYTLWQAMVHVMMYPTILNTHQLMAVGTVSGQKLFDKKTSPVLSATTDSLQLSMRCWDDPVANCAMPCYTEIKKLSKKQ